MFLDHIQNRVRLPGAEVVRPDLVGVVSEEEFHGVHVPLGQVDNMNVVPGPENDSFTDDTLNIHVVCAPGLGTLAKLSVMSMTLTASRCSRLRSPSASSVRRVPIATENAQFLPHPDGNLSIEHR